jgi:hypothetical protein
VKNQKKLAVMSFLFLVSFEFLFLPLFEGQEYFFPTVEFSLKVKFLVLNRYLGRGHRNYRQFKEHRISKLQGPFANIIYREL